MAPAALRDSVGNLPAELTSFVGRRKELGEARALLSSGRLLTLTGMGGVGKTRLALRLALEVHRAFPDGVWQVELAELNEPALVAASIAASLRLAEPQGRWTVGKLQERLADRHLLLVIDNCEHLIDACAVTVDGLLRACPDLHIVATSRQPLGIDGEQTLALAPLSTPDPRQSRDLALLDQFDAARLFVDRAGSVLPGFTLDQDNRGAVAELCQRLDGLPLALEFAALRVRALSLDEIVARLDTGSLSASGSRIAPSRQHTLRSLVDWSFQLCSEPERMLWCRLSLFTGSFALDAAEAIWAGDHTAEQDLVDLIVGLVEKSVLSREAHHGLWRYRMAGTIRAYGLERLAASGDEGPARRSHRDWFVRLTARAYDEYAGHDQLAWFTRLRLEHSDIRGALDFCLTDPEGAEDGCNILIALLDYWIAFGYLSEGRHWLHRLLPKTQGQSLVRARVLRAGCYLAAIQGDQSDSALNQARELASQADSEHELAWCDLTEGVAATLAGDAIRASACLARAEPGMRNAGDTHGLVNVLGARCTAVAMSGGVQAAEAVAQDFFAIADCLGERWLRAYVLWAMGIATWRAGDTDRAAALELESMQVRLAFDDQTGVIWSAEVLSWIAARAGDTQKAAILLGAAQHIAETIGLSIQSIAFLSDDHTRCEAHLRTALGTSAFEAAVRDGGKLRIEQILELATGPSGADPPGRQSVARPEPSPLSRREKEIAELVAEGLSNKEIAARLVIATRTAEGHVEHILGKLGFTSRAQIAAWVAERRTHPAAE